jgi:tRNA(adenine34) deaminase
MAEDPEAVDRMFMGLALEEARGCMSHGDVPVGCVIARDGKVLSTAGNQRELRGDPTAHAEMVALRDAASGPSWRLEGCTLYVTLEPCAMCAGAMVLSRIDRLVIGADDPRAGFAGSLGNLVQDKRLNHRVEVDRGVLGEGSAALLREFFRERRGIGSAG